MNVSAFICMQLESTYCLVYMSKKKESQELTDAISAGTWVTMTSCICLLASSTIWPIWKNCEWGNWATSWYSETWLVSFSAVLPFILIYVKAWHSRAKWSTLFKADHWLSVTGKHLGMILQCCLSISSKTTRLLRRSECILVPFTAIQGCQNTAMMRMRTYKQILAFLYLYLQDLIWFLSWKMKEIFHKMLKNVNIFYKRYYLYKLIVLRTS